MMHNTIVIHNMNKHYVSINEYIISKLALDFVKRSQLQSIFSSYS